MTPKQEQFEYKAHHCVTVDNVIVGRSRHGRQHQAHLLHRNNRVFGSIFSNLSAPLNSDGLFSNKKTPLNQPFKFWQAFGACEAESNRSIIRQSVQ